VSDRGSVDDELRCIDLVEEISAYVDGELDDVERSRIERHLEGCPGCRAAIDQFETVIRLGGRLTAADVATLDPLIRDRLTGTLRVPRRR
jgi:anti-sigma factor RsiW